jgi:tRNA modification GTPase
MERRHRLRYGDCAMSRDPADTIFAFATPAGVSALAVLRLSGPRAGDAVRAVTQRPLPAPRRAARRTLHDGDTGGAFDDALVLWFPAPRSFTGEDVAEIQLHGSRAACRALIASLQAMPGLRLARAGEFARRAFDRGKLDLAQVEALADLLEAETAQQARQAMRQLSGGLGAACESWRARILAARARVEAEIDFPDDDLPGGLSAAVMADLAAIGTEIATVLADGRRGERLRDGFSVALVGPVNSGKSSILNVLAGREAAIVSTLAGTTRDVIEVDLDLGGWPVTIADTAGLRDIAGATDATHDAIESEGIRRAQRRAGAADLNLVVLPADVGAPALAEPLVAALLDTRAAVVWNKGDLRPDFGPLGGITNEQVVVSARLGHGMDGLVRLIEQRAAGALGAGSETGLITRARHREVLEAAHAALCAAQLAPSSELVAEELRQASDAIGRITGRTGVEDMLDLLFTTFCIGK